MVLQNQAKNNFPPEKIVSGCYMYFINFPISYQNILKISLI